MLTHSSLWVQNMVVSSVLRI